MSKRRAAAKQGAVTKQVQAEIAAVATKHTIRLTTPNRLVAGAVRDQFIAYQAQNIQMEKWVEISINGLELTLVGEAKSLENSVNRIADFQRLIEEDFASRESHVVSDGKSAYFKQGDISFPVHAKDLNEVVGANGGICVIDSLMDSQVVSLAQANSLSITPYVRELLRPVLVGIVQMAWKRDIEHYESDHLYQNQMARTALYLRQLSEYKAEDKKDLPRSSRAPRKAAQDKWAKSYQLVAKWEGDLESGRETQVLEVLRSLKSAPTLAQIVEAAKGKVDTKQDLTKIVNRFLGKLIAAGAIQEVKS